MFKQVDSSNRQKMNDCFSQKNFTAKCKMIFASTHEGLIRRCFTVKATKKA